MTGPTQVGSITTVTSVVFATAAFKTHYTANDSPRGRQLRKVETCPPRMPTSPERLERMPTRRLPTRTRGVCTSASPLRLRRRRPTEEQASRLKPDQLFGFSETEGGIRSEMKKKIPYHSNFCHISG